MAMPGHPVESVKTQTHPIIDDLSKSVDHVLSLSIDDASCSGSSSLTLLQWGARQHYQQRGTVGSNDLNCTSNHIVPLWSEKIQANS
ncbi:hypothetical protein OIU79_016578 [Salix purpurea]|uniref:Uncharacterized protein n=1 Tax=Salix purpurea TaxID=77065 RepID=A0A9Q0PER3_SALPP|nr:hypothetical protein OIU79_016578 [Salix purpurea]